jgi:uncharacterized protein (TIGR02757 family)
MVNNDELKTFLDFKVEQYNRPDFIEPDPIAIPHRFSLKEDIEIAGFLVSTFAWGNRKAIVSNGHKLMDLLGNAPYDFVLNHKAADLKKLNHFVHRTFNATDLIFFIKSLKNIYVKHGGIEQIFIKHANSDSLQPAIHEFKKVFFEIPHLERTSKHVSDPFKGSAAKKINMYLRWMIRKDKCGVDFGIWKTLSPTILSCPLDVHSGNVARKLGLLDRTQNDHKAVLELDASLRKLDPTDPVKYDFALFGLGVFEGF